MKSILLFAAAIPFLVAAAQAEADLTPRSFLQEAAARAAKEPTPPSAPRPLPPQPVTPGFRSMMDLWSAGKTPSQETLTGDWRAILNAFEPAKCRFMGEDVYREDGVLDAVGGVMGLHFERQSLPGAPVGVFAVNVLSGGKTTDGPFRVADSEPQFAVWPSPGGANDNKASFWELSCRTMPGNDSAIVCAEQFRMRNPENFDAESRACAAVGYSMVEVYVKLKMTALDKSPL